MGRMEIIPAIDIRGGRCVRLDQGDYDRETVFADDPVEVALHLGEDRIELKIPDAHMIVPMQKRAGRILPVSTPALTCAYLTSDRCVTAPSAV